MMDTQLACLVMSEETLSRQQDWLTIIIKESRKKFDATDQSHTLESMSVSDGSRELQIPAPLQTGCSSSSR